YQDISDIEGAYIKHNQSSKPDFPGHSVKIEKGTKLFDILGEKVITNSFHHQAVKDVAKGFIVTAVAADGVIEGIEK
ncbi:gamma-glutamyl-gamma-aminobutyrate hydrolase family protein, partial [Thermoanaerobacter thermohydrosulfuricus]